MDFRDRVISPISRFTIRNNANVASGRLSREDLEIRVDFGDLVRKLVLSEQLVIESCGLHEFPLLVRRFGYDGVLEMLSSGVVAVCCELTGMASFGDDLPLGRHRMGTFHADHDTIVDRGLARQAEILELNSRQEQRLRRALSERITPPLTDEGVPMLTKLNADIDTGNPIVKLTVARLGRTRDKSLVPSDFSLEIYRVRTPTSPDDSFSKFQVVEARTDLGKRLGINEQEVHNLIGSALHALGELNKRFGLMEQFHGVTGFRSGELSLFEQKLAFLARELDPDVAEERFSRVVEIADLPDVASSIDARDVNLARLIEIVQSDEVRAFRVWLRGIDSVSDAEIHDAIRKLRETVRAALQSKRGKTMRMCVSAGLSLIPGAGPIVGTAATAVDALVIDNLVSKPGPTAFVSHLYPSIFNEAA